MIFHSPLISLLFPLNVRIFFIVINIMYNTILPQYEVRVLVLRNHQSLKTRGIASDTERTE